MGSHTASPPIRKKYITPATRVINHSLGTGGIQQHVLKALGLTKLGASVSLLLSVSGVRRMIVY